MTGKYKTVVLLLSACITLACSSKQESGRRNSDSVATITTSSDSIEKFGPEPTDTIRGNDYERLEADTAVVKRIRAALPEILKKELVGAQQEDRRFSFDQADLNGDGKAELLIALTGMNWCGSGGCTALILTSETKLVTRFTVVGFPFIILNAKSNGWNDLVVYSGHSNRILKFNGKKYPSNPSVQPKFQVQPASTALKALAIADKPYPKFDF